MTAYSHDEIKILILGKDQTIWLISPVALSRATDVMFGIRKLRKEYVGSKVISADGSLKVISGIKRGSLLGETFLEKISSMLSGTYEIVVDYKPKTTLLSIDEIKNQLVDNLKQCFDSYEEDHFFLISDEKKVAINKILKDIDGAENYADIVSAFGYTKDSCGCLDGL